MIDPRVRTPRSFAPRRVRRLVLGAGAALALLAACGGGDRVALYCSVDQDQSVPIVEAYRAATGTEVDVAVETEASRSIGLARRLELERARPSADVFWANEPMNTAVLRDLGLLAPLPKDVLESVPAAWRDPKGAFVGFAARARVLLVNTKLLPDPTTWPTSVADLLDPAWGGEGRRLACARPLNGTTLTHAVALLSQDEAKGRAFFVELAARGRRGEVKLVPGNGAVMQQVADPANGVAWGLTDTDDARAAVVELHAPVAVVYPDQGEGMPGALVLPNTLSLVKGGPHPEAALTLLRWLLSKDVEARLSASAVASIPVRDDVASPAHVKRVGRDFRAMPVDWDALGANRDRWLPFLEALFAR